jgi:hypothetical protein
MQTAGAGRRPEPRRPQARGEPVSALQRPRAHRGPLAPAPHRPRAAAALGAIQRPLPAGAARGSHRPARAAAPARRRATARGPPWAAARVLRPPRAAVQALRLPRAAAREALLRAAAARVQHCAAPRRGAPPGSRREAGRQLGAPALATPPPCRPRPRPPEQSRRARPRAAPPRLRLLHRAAAPLARPLAPHPPPRVTPPPRRGRARAPRQTRRCRRACEQPPEANRGPLGRRRRPPPRAPPRLGPPCRPTQPGVPLTPGPHAQQRPPRSAPCRGRRAGGGGRAHPDRRTRAAPLSGGNGVPSGGAGMWSARSATGARASSAAGARASCAPAVGGHKRTAGAGGGPCEAHEGHAAVERQQQAGIMHTLRGAAAHLGRALAALLELPRPAEAHLIPAVAARALCTVTAGALAQPRARGGCWNRSRAAGCWRGGLNPKNIDPGTQSAEAHAPTLPAVRKVLPDGCLLVSTHSCAPRTHARLPTFGNVEAEAAAGTRASARRYALKLPHVHKANVRFRRRCDLPSPPSLPQTCAKAGAGSGSVQR